MLAVPFVSWEVEYDVPSLNLLLISLVVVYAVTVSYNMVVKFKALHTLCFSTSYRVGIKCYNTVKKCRWYIVYLLVMLVNSDLVLTQSILRTFLPLIDDLPTKLCLQWIEVLPVARQTYYSLYSGSLQLKFKVCHWKWGVASGVKFLRMYQSM